MHLPYSESPSPLSNRKEGIMRIALIGQAAFGADVLKGLIKQGQQVVGVFCPRTGAARLDPLKDAALAAGIPVLSAAPHEGPPGL